MVTGKDTILKYCGQFSASTIEHMENSLENKRYIEKGEYSQLVGCPDNYGLGDFEGLCYSEDVGNNYKLQCEQCERCWKKALESKK